MNEGYVLEWLDNLITVALNPGKASINFIQADDIANFQKHIEHEKHRTMRAIKIFVFSMKDENNIRSGVKLYHSSLIALMGQSIDNQNRYKQNSQLKQIYNELIACINELILFIESRFFLYLDTDVKFSATYSFLSKKELIRKILRISENFSRYPEFRPASDILIHTLLNYINLPAEQHLSTFQDISYVKELCSEMEQIELSSQNGIFTALDKRLIYMNFNHQTYVDDLFRRLTDDISGHDSIIDRMEKLLFHLKSFRQLHRKPNVVFDSKFQDLHSILNNWFKQEVFYLQKRMTLSAKPQSSPAQPSGLKNPNSNSNQKVICSLSSDQIALVIRAAAELKILTGRSLNSLFRIIVPHLSTPYRQNLSFDGVRSKAYVAEQRDKDIIIEVLEKIIKKIKEY